MAKRLFAGPWVGELGWELMMWQAHIRAIAILGEYDEVIIATRPGHDFLYKDFMTDFVPYPIEGATDCELCDSKTYNDFFKNTLVKGDVLVKVQRFPTWKSVGGDLFFKFQKFVKYGNKTGKNKFDIIVHARNTNKRNTAYRNWPMDRWNNLISELKGHNIACIGTKHAAAHLAGTTDMRGIPMSDLCDMMADSKLVIGTSSGPLHLASLCGTPHVVLSHGCNIERYEKHWNPFNTKVKVVEDEKWNPYVSEVLNGIKEIL